MEKSILTIAILSLAFFSYCQTNEVSPKLNLAFESIESGKPIGWENFGSANYQLSLDSVNVREGNYSASIEFKTGSPDFKAWALTLPDNYAGEKITLSGYIKTENVSDGFAGLWMRIDPSIAFDNMQEVGIRGTTDWTKYEITLDMMPEKTKQIVIGGLLAGKGKIWLDELSVSVDGVDIKDLQPFVRKLFPAELDHEFDEGSKITTVSIDNSKVENLKTLALIWGFLKYYHPTIAAGGINWDYELFRIMPLVLDAKDNNDRDAILVKWINQFGQVTMGDESKFNASETKLEPDLGWIDNTDFSKELSSLLHKVKNANRQEEHFYIELQPNIGNPEFKNENQYASFKYPDTGYRLLALFRYWNMIQYYFPYKNLIEEDWKNVLGEFIPKMIEAANETEYTLALLELIGRVHDTHANIWGGSPALRNYFGTRYASIELKFVEAMPVVAGYFDDALGLASGLKKGDIITSVNNRTVEEIAKDQLKYTPASNYPTQLRDLASRILRTNDSTIQVKFLRDGTLESAILKTYSSTEINIYKKFQVKDTCFRMINDDIAYINHGFLKRDHLPGLWEEIKNTKGLIIDIRNYPADFPIYDLSNYLMPDSIPFVKFSSGSIKTPGLFTYTEPLIAGTKNEDSYKGKVVIIVNEISQSSAEFHSMAYRVHPRATVIGSTTAGADGNVSEIYLPGGIRTMISGIGVYYPDGSETQRIGIVPDIEVKPTIRGITKGEDELLDKAIEIINGQ